VGITDRRAGTSGSEPVPGRLPGAYGLGLVMDNTDYIQYRKTGYGFNQRCWEPTGT